MDFEISGTYSENESITLYAVWEKSLLAETVPDASVTLNGHTYEYYSGAYTYAYAQNFADIKGGYLASVTSANEYSAVLSLTKNASAPCWLGGLYTSGNWTWTTGEAFMDDFAESKWAADEPSALYGANAKGRLVQTAAGEWKDFGADSLETGGFIIEYGSIQKEELPVYLVCVDTSLRLREGPGTSYDTLSYMYPGALITIYDIYPGASYNWGWGITDTGAKGWCAMKIPSYMIEASGIDEDTGLVYCLNTDGIAITGYTGSNKTLTVPDTIGNLKITEILSDSFTRDTVPTLITLPSGIRDIASDAFDSKTSLHVYPGSSTHAACVSAGYSPVCILPPESIVPPSALCVLEEDAFSHAAKVKVVDLSATSVAVIPKGAFSGMSSLSCVLLPASVTKIEDGAFDEGSTCVIAGSKSLQSWCDASGHTLIPVFE
ncbi:MAG: leucine-rich repeat protein [Clostridia bacterium]|nr:leucine-rich repeat protein [Clostridia bacterium]